MSEFDSSYHRLFSLIAGTLFIGILTLTNHVVWRRVLFQKNSSNSKMIVAFLATKNLLIVATLVVALIFLNLEVISFSVGCFIGFVGGLLLITCFRTS